MACSAKAFRCVDVDPGLEKDDRVSWSAREEAAVDYSSGSQLEPQEPPPKPELPPPPAEGANPFEEDVASTAGPNPFDELDDVDSTCREEARAADAGESGRPPLLAGGGACGMQEMASAKWLAGDDRVDAL